MGKKKNEKEENGGMGGHLYRLGLTIDITTIVECFGLLFILYPVPTYCQRQVKRPEWALWPMRMRFNNTDNGDKLSTIITPFPSQGCRSIVLRLRDSDTIPKELILRVSSEPDSNHVIAFTRSLHMRAHVDWRITFSLCAAIRNPCS